jgi:hypothetical protein
MLIIVSSEQSNKIIFLIHSIGCRLEYLCRAITCVVTDGARNQIRYAFALFGLNRDMILIWDTCALNEICRATALHIKRTSSPLIAPGTRGVDFLDILRNMMAELQARCEHSSHTADVVFEEEIDPTTAGSRLRDQDELVEHFCTRGTFKADWLTLLENSIAVVPVHDGEIEALRGIVQPHPGHCDVSLIVAALKLSTQTGQNCAIVTNDMSLIDRINDVKRNRRQVFLNGHEHSTNLLISMVSLEVLRELYLSCGLDHDFYRSALFSYKEHHNGHYGQAGQKHCQYVADFFSQFYVDRDEKERRRATAELGPAFGVDNA